MEANQPPATISEHKRILQGRYQHLLGQLTDLDAVAEKLELMCLLSQLERVEVEKRCSRQEKQMYLCHALTIRGISKLVDISRVLKSEQSQSQKAGDAGSATSGMAAEKPGDIESKKTEGTGPERGALGHPRRMNVTPGVRPQQGDNVMRFIVVVSTAPLFPRLDDIRLVHTRFCSR